MLHHMPELIIALIVLSVLAFVSEASISRMRRGGLLLEEGSKSFELAALTVRAERRPRGDLTNRAHPSRFRGDPLHHLELRPPARDASRPLAACTRIWRT